MAELLFAVISVLAIAVGIFLAIRNSVKQGRFWKDARTLAIIVIGSLIFIAIVASVSPWITITALVGFILYLSVSLVGAK
jgi:predicted membrane chloride channel (bestrophin family)